ncbi:polygalacturonase inhibitor precursor [Iris pallida]|uniref:Polygalacturonase inhibitor n=1 Tax=Iris pallida TaxID=29817 RepID=A0AAX6FIT7_IRIPA|nr:polygalacturonase inhibitor precursor [Iris pallida]
MAYHHTQLPFVFFLLLITTLSSFPSPSSSPPATPPNGQPLSIMSAMGDPYVIVAWGGTSDCCEWNGVKCDSAGHVTSLHTRYVVAGTISPAIGDLPYLTD